MDPFITSLTVPATTQGMNNAFQKLTKSDVPAREKSKKGKSKDKGKKDASDEEYKHPDEYVLDLDEDEDGKGKGKGKDKAKAIVPAASDAKNVADDQGLNRRSFSQSISS